METIPYETDIITKLFSLWKSNLIWCFLLGQTVGRVTMGHYRKPAFSSDPIVCLCVFCLNSYIPTHWFSRVHDYDIHVLSSGVQNLKTLFSTPALDLF